MAKALGVKVPRAEWGLSLLSSVLPCSIRSRASAMDRNHEAFRHSARGRLLNASMAALSVGLPGREKSISPLQVGPLASMHPANSGP